MNAVRKCSASYVETDIDEEKVVMNLDSGEFFSLRETALSAWNLIDGQRDQKAIATALAEEYAAPLEVASSDLDAFFAELEAAGLIERG